MRNPQNETVAADNKANGASPERTCILSRRKGTRDELIRLALVARRRGRAGRPRPRPRPRRMDRRRPRRARRSQCQGQAEGGAATRVQDQRHRVPADLGERIEHALRKTALDRLGMEARAGNLINGADRIEAAARAGKVRLLIHAFDSSEDGRKRGPGLARGRRRAARGDFPRGAHYVVIGPGARKCGTCRPDRSCRCRACPTRARAVASFH